MAEAAADAEEVEQFMVSKALSHAVKQRKFQGVDHAANRVDNPACKQPRKRAPGERRNDIAHHKDTQPAHNNINHCGKPFWAGNPKQRLKDADDGESPDHRKQGMTFL